LLRDGSGEKPASAGLDQDYGLPASPRANKLTKHVGQQVEITGTPGLRTVGTTIQGGASSTKEQQVFKVKSVKHIADTCTSAGH
jgi:hypothetical protein